MQRAKEKLVLEQVVVQNSRSQQVRQAELDDLLRYGAEELFGENPSAAEVGLRTAAQGVFSSSVSPLRKLRFLVSMPCRLWYASSSVLV